MGEIERGSVGNVQKSAQSMRDWGESRQNQAARMAGNGVGSAGDIEKSRRSPDPLPEPIRGEWSRLGGARLKCTNVGGNESCVGDEWPQNQAALIDGQSLRIFRKYTEIKAAPDSGYGSLLVEWGASHVARLKCTNVGENEARIGRIWPKSGGLGRRAVD